MYLVTWIRCICHLSLLMTLSSPPNCIFRKKPLCADPPSGVGSWVTFFSGWSFYLNHVILLLGWFVSSPHLIVIKIFTYLVQTHGYYFYTLGYNRILPCSFAPAVPDPTIGSAVSWTVRPSGVTLSLFCFILFRSISWLSSTTQCSRSFLYVSGPNPRMRHFPETCVFTG